ncbi:HlyD family efflux transporter periplasmic adaptor subunit [Paenibacillus rhizovicinus]|uniref:HlyD family efflux transporter periplasmic adaptor subunit n=1 Tax=Paenibacillus rhizovicinus TaxID=2704463 RepID=A0A6C0NUE8_9BACL|nr:HlyD family efflux transporter periplasmic adaptor subunit [Paenibacillus rhizovicinus]QHW29840.1 HlyD family efflux transporter periplasmic adaptor subunit [Paenibacillus rhizovicinus]
MESENVPAERRRKRIIQIAFFLFMGVLLFFTLFSNTLQSLTLPKVRTEKPSKGSLVVTLAGSGMLQPAVEAKLSNTAGWKADKILVKEGDRVKKGQKLILYDSRTAESELKDEVTVLNKQNIGLRNIQDQYILSMHEGDELQIRKLKRDIETSQLDLGTQERKIAELRDRLVSQQEINAPFDGIITRLNAVEGLVSAGQPDLLITNSIRGYRLDISADSALVAEMGISIGAKIEVEVDTGQDHQTRIVQGTIDEIANTDPRPGSPTGDEETDQALSIPQKTLRIQIMDSGLKGGEQAKIKLENRSRQEGLLVSNEAIHHDRDGAFVYRIEEQRGALGNVYIARKIQIQASEASGKETMIQSDSLYEDDLIILESSEPLQDGNRVRLQ